MHSSISSSNDRLPAGLWIRSWVLALAMTIAFLGSWEGMWRLRGFVPSMDAVEVDAWIVARRKVRADSTVLLGTSRLQSAVDPHEWASAISA